MIWKIIGAVIILSLVGAFGYYYYQNMDTATEEKAPTASVSETPSPTPTAAEVKKDEFTIKILNGSGVVGEAGRAKTLLEDAKFKVDSTANADKYDYEETVIQAGSAVSDAWIEQLTKELEGKYTVKGTVEELGKDEDTDVVVIVGSFDADGKTMVKEEAKPTAKATDEAKTTTTTTPTKSPTPTPTKSN